MDYLGYYKLALQQTYGGEFPGMDAAEFDRRCALPHVPKALRALYLVLGCSRICRMHVFIPAPEELCDDGNLVVVAKAGNRVWAIASEELSEENPLVYTVVDRKEDDDGNDITVFGHDGQTRVALLMVNLIAQSAGETEKARISAYAGRCNRFRNSLTWLTRKRLFLGSLAALTLLYILCSNRLMFVLNELAPPWASLSILLFLLLLAVPVGTALRIYFYWNIWLDGNDNVRFDESDNPLSALIHDLTLTYLRWNQPELWFAAGSADFRWNPAIHLRAGARRYCQSRYDFIAESDGAVHFPGFAPIRHHGGKALSLLLRSTLDDDGSLLFTHVETGRRWKLPKPGKVQLQPVQCSQPADGVAEVNPVRQ